MDEIELNHQNNSLSTFLQAKPLYYDEIDYDRMPRIFETVRSQLPYGKIIHIIGTNGKGTTGRFLASALHVKGFRVGHYTSPHIRKFNERIWKNGKDVSDDALQVAHEKLITLLGVENSDALSYFEYTTLLAIIIFAKCDYIVLEAGLGGEYDATAVFTKALTLVTPIDFDHQAFLGTSITSIATTKLRAMQKRALIGYQKHQEVYDITTKIGKQKDASITFLKDLKSKKKIDALAKKVGVDGYLKENLALAAAAIEMLGYEVCAEEFQGAALFGRMSQIAPNITLDVGHNALAARAIAKQFAGEKVILVYNTYKDKEYESILDILRPIIKRVEIIAVKDARILPLDILQASLERLGLDFKMFDGIAENEKYLVFGSFSVAEQFLKEYDGQ